MVFLAPSEVFFGLSEGLFPAAYRTRAGSARGELALTVVEPVEPVELMEPEGRGGGS